MTVRFLYITDEIYRIYKVWKDRGRFYALSYGSIVIERNLLANTKGGYYSGHRFDDKGGTGGDLQLCGRTFGNGEKQWTMRGR